MAGWTTRQELDELCRRRSMRDRHTPRTYAPLTTDAVLNALIILRADIAEIRNEMDELRIAIDSNNDDMSLTQLESRVEELEAAVDA